jgi:hypothetical protein
MYWKRAKQQIVPRPILETGIAVVADAGRPVSKAALPVVLFDLIGKLVPTHSRLKLDFLGYLVVPGFGQRFGDFCLAAIFFG